MKSCLKNFSFRLHLDLSTPRVIIPFGDHGIRIQVRKAALLWHETAVRSTEEVKGALMKLLDQRLDHDFHHEQKKNAP